MEAFIPFVVTLVIGVAVGAMGYRYWLKRDPVALELWAQKLKELGK
jgi:ABC-type antimicrobial peptide transport system permease subunit